MQGVGLYGSRDRDTAQQRETLRVMYMMKTRQNILQGLHTAGHTYREQETHTERERLAGTAEAEAVVCATSAILVLACLHHHGIVRVAQTKRNESHFMYVA